MYCYCSFYACTVMHVLLLYCKSIVCAMHSEILFMYYVLRMTIIFSQSLSIWPRAGGGSPNGAAAK